MQREQLIVLCEKAIVTEDKWRNRDSCDAQLQIGEAWALLRAGCPFELRSEDITEHTVWIDITSKGFGYWENGNLSTKCFYIPTEKRLKEANGGDWY